MPLFNGRQYPLPTKVLRINHPLIISQFNILNFPRSFKPDADACYFADVLVYGCGEYLFAIEAYSKLMVLHNTSQVLKVGEIATKGT